jgi:hypothetical protein
MESLKHTLSITGLIPTLDLDSKTICVAKFAVVVPKAGLSKPNAFTEII